jgi:hypothetical protein
MSVSRFSPNFAAHLVVPSGRVHATPLAAGAVSDQRDETFNVYDAHESVPNTDVLVDRSVPTKVEILADEYTQNLDGTLDAEFACLPRTSFDGLIDEARRKIEDAIDWGRSLAGCVKHKSRATSTRDSPYARGSFEREKPSWVITAPAVDVMSSCAKKKHP